MPGGPQRSEEGFSRPYGQAQQQQQQSMAGHAPNDGSSWAARGSTQQSHAFGSSDPFAPMGSMFSGPSSSARHDPFARDPFDDPFFRQPFGGGGLFGGLLGSFFQGMSALPQLQSSFHHHQQQQQQRRQEQQHQQHQQWQWQQQQHQQPQEVPRQAPAPLSVQEVDPTSPDAAFGTTGQFTVEHPDSDSEESDVEEVPGPHASGAAGGHTSSGYYQDPRPHHGQQQPYYQQQQPYQQQQQAYEQQQQAYEQQQQTYQQQQQAYQQQQQAYQQQQQQQIITTEHPFSGMGSLLGGGSFSSSFSFQSSYVSHGGIGGTQYYTESSSRRVGPGGVVEEQHSQRDSSGRESMRLSRGIDEKGRTLTRSRQGQEETSAEILHNITPEEARTFDATWQRRARGDFSDAGQGSGQLPCDPRSSGRRTSGA